MIDAVSEKEKEFYEQSYYDVRRMWFWKDYLRQEKRTEGYIRLSIDEEMWKLYGRKGIDYPEEQYEKLSEQVEAALQKKLLSLIQQGKDVVIDFSFWSKENRNFYKELIQKAGAETELVYMKASKELLQKKTI